MRPLFKRVWQAVLANRGLVVTILAIGFLQAALTKLPLALLQPLLGSLSPTPLSEATHEFTLWFESVSAWICDVLGLSFEGTPDSVRKIKLCVGVVVVTPSLGLLGAFTIYGTLVLTRYFAVKIVVDLRNEIASHILKLPLRFFGERRMGELISNITNDTTVLSRGLTLACDHVVVDPLLVMWNMILIIWFLPEATWFLLLMLPLMAIPMIRLGRKVQRSSSKSLAAMGDATESMNQILSGIRAVKAFQLEEQRLDDFRGTNRQYLRRTTRMLRAKALSQGLVFASYQLGAAAMIGGGAWLVLRGEQDFTALTVGIIALGTTYTHVKRLTRAYNTLMESGGALERIEDLLEQTPDAGSDGAGIELRTVGGNVEFQHVGFAYDTETVVRDMSFTARPGETVALVGPSGAGKSTALDLLTRFHDPDDGRVLIDGHDLRDLNLASYRRHLATVSQQPFLFNTTILENIRCGRPDATEPEVVEAAKAAQIHDFITALPEGYESIAGERGCNLSGGQMQRITIARALLRDPAILVLDEATSALDSESEGAVQKALDHLMQGRTCFVIAHRLSTVANADQILVMDAGRVIERGTHAELIEKDGLYARLSQLQQLA